MPPNKNKVERTAAGIAYIDVDLNIQHAKKIDTVPTIIDKMPRRTLSTTIETGFSLIIV